MPLHTDTEYDPLSRMIRFKTSIVLEMLLSMQTVSDSWRRPELTEEVRNALGESFLKRLHEFYVDYHQGCDFTEIAMDTEFHHDIPAFLDSIREMSHEMLAFYILGRRFKQEDIPKPLSSSGILSMIRARPDSEELLQCCSYLDWADEIDEVRKKLLYFWETFWEGYFHEKVESFKVLWDESIREKQEHLQKNGGTALFASISGWEELPDPLPRSMPYSKIEFYPVHTGPQKHLTYYGYGVVSVLYDCTKTEEKGREIREGRDNAIVACKALGDKNRLKILKLISLNEKSINGQRIASKLELSPSVVSRHLTMLKEAGLIEEYSPDNRNITYSIKIDAITALPGKIQDYFAD